VSAAESAAVHFRANAESVDLLNETCTAAGRAGGGIASLTRLRKSRPNDHGLLYALADLLHSTQHEAQAKQLLEEAAASEPADFEILRRRYASAMESGDRATAARLLVRSSAAAPASTIESNALWNELSRPTSQGRLRWADLAQLE